MSDREMVYQLVDHIPDYKLSYAIAYLQGLTDGAKAELKKETLVNTGTHSDLFGE